MAKFAPLESGLSSSIPKGKAEDFTAKSFFHNDSEAKARKEQILNLVMTTVVRHFPKIEKIFPKDQFPFKNTHRYDDKLPQITERMSFPIFMANENKYSDIQKIYDVNKVGIKIQNTKYKIQNKNKKIKK